MWGTALDGGISGAGLVSCQPQELWQCAASLRLRFSLRALCGSQETMSPYFANCEVPVVFDLGQVVFSSNRVLSKVTKQALQVLRMCGVCCSTWAFGEVSWQEIRRKVFCS